VGAPEDGAIITRVSSFGPVDVAGGFWSGKGLLTEVNPDQKRCKVAIRDRALFVHHLWVDCTTVHPRSGRD